MNYAELYNRGVEVSLESDNLRSGNFLWNTTLNFSYNKNMVTGVESPQNTVASHVQGNNGGNGYLMGTNTREGMPLGTLYSFRWAGLDENGRPQVYKKDGSIAKSMTDVGVEDLVRNGTTIPPYSASMTNTLRWKGLSMSFLLIYYGGHEMRDVMATYITAPQNYNSTGLRGNLNKNIMNYWKSAEDSPDPSKSPAIYRNASTNTTHLWYGADKHILKADYLKLREITLSYDLPQRLLSRIGIEGLTLHAQVQNVWTWSANGKGLDPESWNGVYYLSQYIYPTRSPLAPTTWSFGLTLKL